MSVYYVTKELVYAFNWAYIDEVYREVWRALKRLRHEQLLRFSKALECALSMNQLINVCTRHDDIHTILNEVLLLPFSVTFRTVFSFLSGVLIYATAWGLLGLDSGDASGPNSPSYLTVRSFPPNRFRSNILQWRNLALSEDKYTCQTAEGKVTLWPIRIQDFAVKSSSRDTSLNEISRRSKIVASRNRYLPLLN